MLLLFARRRAVEAIRSQRLPLAHEAVAALTLVDSSKIDFRDLSVAFPLFAVRELGGDVAAGLSEAVESSEPGTAASFAATRGRAGSISLRHCALVRVTTAHGVGFMEDWVGSATPPLAAAELAVRLADSIEAEGTYVDARFRVSELPRVWFGGPHERVDERVSGCVSIDLRHIMSERPFSHTLFVFVAEVPDEQIGVELCARAEEHSTADRPRVAVAEGRFIVTLIAGSATSGEPALESPESLRRLVSIAESVLGAAD